MSCLFSGNNENIAVMHPSVMLMKGYNQLKYFPPIAPSPWWLLTHGNQWLEEGNDNKKGQPN